MKDKYVAEASREVGDRERNEYNSFGPWVQEIKAAEDLPPRFDQYWGELRAAACVAKVPYHVERREALPGSDLYEHLIAVGTSGIILLSIDGDSILRRDLGYARVSTIALSSELLDGRLFFREPGGPGLELRFNAVSAPLARTIVDLARQRCLSSRMGAAAGARTSGPGLIPPPGEGDIHFMNLLAELQSREDGLSLLAYQAPCRVEAGAGQRRSLGQSLLDLFRRRYLSSAMIVEGSSEIVVVRAAKDVRRRKSGSYWYETMWMPLSSLEGASLEPRPQSNGGIVFALRLDAPDGLHELYFSAPPEAALARLMALARA